MKSFTFILPIIIISFPIMLNAQFEALASNQNQRTHNTQQQSQNYQQTNTQQIISPVSVPRDLTDITGQWYNDKNDCIVSMQWNGSQWIGVVLETSRNKKAKPGEIIIELFPSETNKAFGRMKVFKKRSFEWVEVDYKLSFTKMKGKHEWKFYGK